MKKTVVVMLIALLVSAIGCSQRTQNSSGQSQFVSNAAPDSSRSEQEDLSRKAQTEEAKESDASVDEKEDSQADTIAVDDLVQEEFTIDILNELGESVGRTDTITLGIPKTWSTEDDRELIGVDSVNFYTSDGARALSVISSRMAAAQFQDLDSLYRLEAISSEELIINGIPAKLFVSENPIYKDGEEAGTDFMYAYHLRIDDHYLCILYFMPEQSDSARALTENLLASLTLM